MKGAIRFGVSDSAGDTNDSALQNKRIMAGSPFDFHRAEPSQQPFMTTPPLDAHRAESSRQHVRALNAQFASWVQTQLQNHPDELWEDGVQDYLTHASNIMEKFSDVVNWIKANAVKGESSSVSGSSTAEKKLVPETNNIGGKLFQEKTSFFPANTTSVFTPSWSSGVLPSSQAQAPIIFGNQSSVPTSNDVSEDADGENEMEQPGSPSVKKAEEKGIIVVHEVKCKLYVKSTDPADKDTWKDKGTGQLTIKCKEGIDKGTKESKPTVVVRNDVGKVLLNALLYPGIKTNPQKNSLVAIFHTTGEISGNDGGGKDGVVARTYLIRTKSEEDRNKLATAIQEYAPS